MIFFENNLYLFISFGRLNDWLIWHWNKTYVLKRKYFKFSSSSVLYLRLKDQHKKLKSFQTSSIGRMAGHFARPGVQTRPSRTAMHQMDWVHAKHLISLKCPKEIISHQSKAHTPLCLKAEHVFIKFWFSLEFHTTVPQVFFHQENMGGKGLLVWFFWGPRPRFGLVGWFFCDKSSSWRKRSYATN